MSNVGLINRRPPRLTSLQLAVVLSMVWTVSSFAAQRHFTFVYEPTIEEPGEFELENWVTGQIRKGADHAFSEFDFRHELALAVIDKFQPTPYPADRRHPTPTPTH